MPTVASSVSQLIDLLAGSARLDGDRLVVDDAARFRDATIRDLAWTSAFSDDEATVDAARWLVWEASQELGARSASIHELYAARGRGEVHGFTVPAINLRAQTFDMARTIFETAEAGDVGAVILELARSEQTYTYQRPAEYITSVLAGAIAAGWTGPVFVQGDHYQFNAAKYRADPEKMTEEIRGACRQAIAVGYRNIDIDSSTLVDLSQPDVDREQRENYLRAAELTALIRELEPAGVTISVGGEIGEVGKQNSTEPELRAYLDGYRRELDARRPGAIGISKVSVQTGTSHGGIPLPGRIGRGGQARLRGPPPARRGRPELPAWPAASSTARARCPTSCSTTSRPSRRPRSTSRPASRTSSSSTRRSRPSSIAQIHDWCFANALDERKTDQTDEQFVYSSRKKTIGPFKRQLWELPTSDEILAAQRRKIAFLFSELQVNDSRAMVDRYVRPIEEHRPRPASLAAVAAG